MTARRLLNRRAFLAALSATAVASAAGCAAVPPRPATADGGLDRFMTLSRRLTGVEDLDPELARLYLAALEAAGAWPGRDEAAAAEAVVLAWYTGGVGAGREATIVTYPGALAWSTLTFTKAPSVCGGGPGSWAVKP